MSAKASGSDARPNGDAKQHDHHDGSAGRAYTVEQKAAVIRITKCSRTAFYDIMGLETTCSDSDIKKAYRKLSLLTHPDKNGYQGAGEAFKMVSRAYGVLKDPDLRAKYDKFGGDPDSRFGGAPPGGASSPFSNFARSSGGGRPGPMFEEEISPEEMFRQFFGGGGPFGGPFGGGIFDTGPGFVFNLGGGGPGVRVHQFGGGRPRRRPGTAQPPGSEPGAPSIGSTLSQLLPLFFLFLLPLLSSVFSGDSTPKGPAIVLDSPRGAQTHGLTSDNLKVPYWVNKRDIEGLSKKELKNLHRQAEQKYIHVTSTRCESEKYKRSQLEQDAQGWFGPDKEKMATARSMPMPNCKKMKDMGFQVYY